MAAPIKSTLARHHDWQLVIQTHVHAVRPLLRCRLGDQATKSAAYAAVPLVCRTASTLYDFVNYAKLINQVSPASASLWSRVHRRRPSAVCFADPQTPAAHDAKGRPCVQMVHESHTWSSAMELVALDGNRPWNLWNVQEVAVSEGRKVGNASWGRGMRHAVGGWFVTKPPMQLAYQVPPSLRGCQLTWLPLVASALV